jgi:hypothetical protein
MLKIQQEQKYHLIIILGGLMLDEKRKLYEIDHQQRILLQKSEIFLFF